MLIVSELFNIAVNYFDARTSAGYSRVLIVSELFNIAVNYFDARTSAGYSGVLIVTELVVSGTQYN